MMVYFMAIWSTYFAAIWYILPLWPSGVGILPLWPFDIFYPFTLGPFYGLFIFYGHLV
jgi:hypothetical protein